MDELIRQKIKDINEMIDINLIILIGISALIGRTLIIRLHGCYLRCCNRIDTAVPKLTPDAARVPVLVEQQEVTHHYKQTNIQIKQTYLPTRTYTPKMTCFLLKSSL